MTTQEGVTPLQPTQTKKNDTHSSEEITEMFRWLKDNVVTRTEFHEELAKFATKEDLKSLATKEDVKKMIAESEYRLKDHTSKEVAKMRDIAYAQNHKTNEFVRVTVKGKAISKSEGDRLVAINPFATN